MTPESDSRQTTLIVREDKIGIGSRGRLPRVVERTHSRSVDFGRVADEGAVNVRD